MKRIAFVSSNELVPWGGSEVLWTYTAHTFAERNYHVSASIKWCRELPEKIADLQRKGADVRVRGVASVSPVQARINRFLPSRYQFKSRSTRFDILLNPVPDLAVISQGGNFDGIDFMEYCIVHSIPFVTISQAASEFYWPDDKMVERLEKAYPLAVKNYFVSKATLRLTELMVGQQLTDAKIIYNPFNVPFDSELPFPPVEESYQLASVARYELYAKGQDLIMQVLADQKWRERNLLVKLYGKGMHSYLIGKLIKYYKLKNVTQEGYQPTLDIWRKNHGLLLTSRYEGLPLSLLEAMLCGRLGIVTDVSGNTEVMTDNVHGFVASAAKAELVDEALERAWRKRDEWELIGRKAQQHIRDIIPVDPVEVFYNELKSLL